MGPGFRYVFSTFDIYFGIFLVALYVLIYLPMIRYRKRYNNIFYLIIMVIANVEFLDIITTHIAFDTHCYINFKCPGPNFFSKLEAMWTAWVLHFFFFAHFLIAVNRFCAVALLSKLDMICSKRNTCIYLGIAALLPLTVKKLKFHNI